jgi:hypothetical protein
LAIYCLGALDDIKELIKILGSTDSRLRQDRDTAIITLRRWMGRDAGNGKRLYDAKKEGTKDSTGLLESGQEYRSYQAQTIFALLHNLSPEPESYQLLAHALMSDKAAIAELAHWHLVRLPLTREMPELPNFDATAPREEREKLADAIRRLVESKQPREPGARPSPGKSGKDNSGRPRGAVPKK